MLYSAKKIRSSIIIFLVSILLLIIPSIAISNHDFFNNIAGLFQYFLELLPFIILGTIGVVYSIKNF